MIHQWIVAGNRGGWARPLVSFGPIPAGSMIGKLEPKELELLDLLDLPVSELRIVFRIENFFFYNGLYGFVFRFELEVIGPLVGTSFTCSEAHDVST